MMLMYYIIIYSFKLVMMPLISLLSSGKYWPFTYLPFLIPKYCCSALLGPLTFLLPLIFEVSKLLLFDSMHAESSKGSKPPNTMPVGVCGKDRTAQNV